MIATPLHISLDQWAQADPDGFAAAVREAVDADDLMANVFEAAQTRTPITFDRRWRVKLDERLARDVAEDVAWVRDFRAARYGDEH